MKWHLKVSILVLTITLLIPMQLLPTSKADDQVTPFPEWKGELLGAASYAALFGHDSDNSLGSSSSAPSSFNPARPPNVSPNTRVNDPQSLPPAGRLGRSETTLSVGGNGNFLVAGWNDADGFARRPFTSPPAIPGAPGLSGYGFSTDGGNTWTDGGTPFIAASPDPAHPACGGIVTRGDPWLDQGGYGTETVYYANLAVYELPAAEAYCTTATSVTTAGVSVHRGHFTETSPGSGTFTFGWSDVQLLKAQPGVGLAVGAPLDFYDKEALAADKLGSRPNVFVSVSNFVGLLSPATAGCGFGQIELWHSYDGGNTWATTPTLVQIDEVQTTPTVDCSTGRLNQGSEPAIAPDGTVFVAWQSGPNFSSGSMVFPLAESIRVARCDNFGAGPCTLILNHAINSMRFSAIQGYNRNRMNDFPRIAVAQSGAHMGRVYVAYPTGSGTPVATSVFPDSDIQIMFTDDGGTTWSGPFAVSPPNDGRKDFWPVVSIDQGGNVDVVYMSSLEANLTTSTSDIECIPGAKQLGGGISQNGLRSSLVDVKWAQSIGGSGSFETPIKVNSVTSNWCKARTNVRPTFGDYIDARSFGNRVFVLWGDGRLAAPAPQSCGPVPPFPVTCAPPPFTGPPTTGPRDRESDVFYSSIFAIGRAPR